MPPGSLLPNIANGGFSDTKPYRNLTSKKRAILQSVDFAHLCFSKFDVARSLASWSLVLAMAVLAHHISNILGLGAEKQMVRAHTFAAVAGVADFQPWSYLALVQLVAKTMGHNVAPSTALDPQLPVPGRCKVSGPVPTVIRLGDVRPEAFFKGWTWAGPVALLRTIVAFASPDVSPPNLKGVLAGFADAIYPRPSVNEGKLRSHHKPQLCGVTTRSVRALPGHFLPQFYHTSVCI